MDAYKLLFGADLTKLPTEVLKSIDAAVRKELEFRRNAKMVSARMATNYDNDSSKLFVADPQYRHEYSKHKNKYLGELLDQDWSHLFFGGNAEEKYYVYLHYEPSGKQVKFACENLEINIQGWPFYVGKGTGDRAYDMKRNQGHGQLLKQILSRHAADEIVQIVKSGLTEAKAFELESKLIYFFGTRYERDRKGCLVNLDIPDRPLMSKPKRK